MSQVLITRHSPPPVLDGPSAWVQLTRRYVVAFWGGQGRWVLAVRVESTGASRIVDSKEDPQC